ILGSPSRKMFLQIAVFAVLRNETIWSENSDAFVRQFFHRCQHEPAILFWQMLNHIQRDAGIELPSREEFVNLPYVANCVLIVGSQAPRFFHRGSKAINSNQLRVRKESERRAVAATNIQDGLTIGHSRAELSN